MTGGLIAIALIALAALVWVAAPLLRAGSSPRNEQSPELDRARELQSRHQQLLASLRDLEDDRTTDKIDEADYEAMRARLSAEAIEVMREMDALKDPRDAAAEAARKRAEPLRHPAAERPEPRA